MYKLVALASLLIRNFVLPNPFDRLENKLNIPLGAIEFPIQPWMLNLIAEPFLVGLAFSAVGIYYIKGSNPAVGSFLFLAIYIIQMGLLVLAVVFNFSITAVITIVVVYLVFIFITAYVKKSISDMIGVMKK